MLIQGYQTKFGGTQMEKVIEIKNLSKVYKNGRGITDINLDIHKGDIFGFLGPNGAGKTTAMKIMTGLIKPDSGDVKILGHSILEEYEKANEKSRLHYRNCRILSLFNSL